jgi:hypothetical protein
MARRRSKEWPMLRKLAFMSAGIVGLAFAALVPAPSQAAPANGAFASNVETGVVQVRYMCIRKSSGRLTCGFYDRYGYWHETRDGGYGGYGYGGGYYGYYRPYGYYGYYRGW